MQEDYENSKFIIDEHNRSRINVMNPIPPTLCGFLKLRQVSPLDDSSFQRLSDIQFLQMFGLVVQNIV